MRLRQTITLVALLCLALHSWASSQADLSTSQQAWLKAHPGIIWGLEKDYPPYLFLDQQQQPAGLSYELLQILQDRTGIKLQASAPQSLTQLLEAAKAAQDPAGAKAARDWLARSGFEDQRLRRLAGDAP